MLAGFGQCPRERLGALMLNDAQRQIRRHQAQAHATYRRRRVRAARNVRNNSGKVNSGSMMEMMSSV